MLQNGGSAYHLDDMSRAKIGIVFDVVTSRFGNGFIVVLLLPACCGIRRCCKQGQMQFRGTFEDGDRILALSLLGEVVPSVFLASTPA